MQINELFGIDSFNKLKSKITGKTEKEQPAFGDKISGYSEDVKTRKEEADKLLKKYPRVADMIEVFKKYNIIQKVKDKLVSKGITESIVMEAETDEVFEDDVRKIFKQLVSFQQKHGAADKNIKDNSKNLSIFNDELVRFKERYLEVPSSDEDNLVSDIEMRASELFSGNTLSTILQKLKMVKSSWDSEKSMQTAKSAVSDKKKGLKTDSELDKAFTEYFNSWAKEYHSVDDMDIRSEMMAELEKYIEDRKDLLSDDMLSKWEGRIEDTVKRVERSSPTHSQLHRDFDSFKKEYTSAKTFPERSKIAKRFEELMKDSDAPKQVKIDMAKEANDFIKDQKFSIYFINWVSKYKNAETQAARNKLKREMVKRIDDGATDKEMKAKHREIYFKFLRMIEQKEKSVWNRK